MAKAKTLPENDPTAAGEDFTTVDANPPGDSLPTTDASPEAVKAAGKAAGKPKPDAKPAAKPAAKSAPVFQTNICHKGKVYKRGTKVPTDFEADILEQLTAHGFIA